MLHRLPWTPSSSLLEHPSVLLLSRVSLCSLHSQKSLPQTAWPACFPTWDVVRVSEVGGNYRDGTHYFPQGAPRRGGAALRRCRQALCRRLSRPMLSQTLCSNQHSRLTVTTLGLRHSQVTCPRPHSWGGEGWGLWVQALPGNHQIRLPLTTRSSRVSVWSVSRRISTSPLWVSLEAGRLHGSFCSCSMISRPWWRGQPLLSWGWGDSATRSPRAPFPPPRPLHRGSPAVPAGSLPPHLHFCNSLTRTDLHHLPYLSIFHSFTLRLKPCLPQEVFQNFAFSHKSNLPQNVSHPLSVLERVCCVIKKAQPPAHRLPLIKTHNVVWPWASRWL